MNHLRDAAALLSGERTRPSRGYPAVETRLGAATRECRPDRKNHERSRALFSPFCGGGGECRRRVHSLPRGRHLFPE
jgi:hypothetical protein